MRLKCETLPVWVTAAPSAYTSPMPQGGLSNSLLAPLPQDVSKTLSTGCYGPPGTESAASIRRSLWWSGLCLLPPLWSPFEVFLGAREVHVFFTNPEPSFLVADRLIADFADPLHGDHKLVVRPLYGSRPIKSAHPNRMFRLGRPIVRHIPNKTKPAASDTSQTSDQLSRCSELSSLSRPRVHVRRPSAKLVAFPTRLAAPAFFHAGIHSRL
jgi:hypothetical protein